MCDKITYGILRVKVNFFGSGISSNLLQTSFLQTKWGDWIRPTYNISLKSPSDNHVQAIRKFMVLVYQEDLRMSVRFWCRAQISSGNPRENIVFERGFHFISQMEWCIVLSRLEVRISKCMPLLERLPVLKVEMKIEKDLVERTGSDSTTLSLKIAKHVAILLSTEMSVSFNACSTRINYMAPHLKSVRTRMVVGPQRSSMPW